jgi:hypothetical protein
MTAAAVEGWCKMIFKKRSLSLTVTPAQAGAQLSVAIAILANITLI